MSGDAASIQASFLLDAVSVLRRGPEGARVLAALPPELLARVDSAMRLDWLPLADHLVMYQTTFDTVGRDEAWRIWHDTMMHTFKNGLFRGLAQRNTVDPTDILRHGPRAWAQVTRHCGHQEFHEDAPRSVRMVWNELPAAIVESEPYLEAMRAKYQAHLTIAGATGETRLVAVAARSATFQLTWRATTSES